MLNGECQLPGDKSISHRVLMFSAIAQGTSTVQNLNTGADVLATQKALQQLGVKFSEKNGLLHIHGMGFGHFKSDNNALKLDCENSGTTARLLCGLLAKQPFDITLVGDASLTKRPMKRLVSALAPFGVNIQLASSHGDPNDFPVQILKNTQLKSANITLPVASAQLKSACILAALQAEGQSHILEPLPSRDHTERLLKLYGANIQHENNTVRVQKSKLQAIDFTVPGDPSSAAFLIVMALLCEGSDFTIKNMGLNPTRIGYISVLRAMGANIEITCDDPNAYEPVGNVRVRTSRLIACNVKRELIPNVIDELPILMIAASCASGVSHFEGIAELRLKESDRIETMIQGLRALSIQCKSTEDSVTLQGGKFQTGTVNSFDDHRIAMSFLCAKRISNLPIEVLNTDCIATSFPEFLEFVK